MELIGGRIPRILIIDDAEINVEILKEMVIQMGYEVVTALNVAEVNEVLENKLPDLVLLDIIMPEIDGYQFCEILKSYSVTQSIPVIFISSLNSKEDREKAYQAGGVGFLNRPLDFFQTEHMINTHIRLYAKMLKLAEDNRRLNMVVSKQAKHFEEEQRRLLTVIARLSEEDQSTVVRKHQEGVAASARLLAQALNFTEKYENKISAKFIEAVEISALIHDIGKIALPKTILLKKGPLTEEEKKIVNTHTTIGYDILEEAYGKTEKDSFIKVASEVIRSHHENWNGTGYPDGLKGEQIPLSARIMRIVDTFDSMLRERSYRPAYSREETLEIMRNDTGIKFDPFLMEVFFKIEKQL